MDVCIICGKEIKKGKKYKVKDDFVIKVIRFIKHKLKIAKNNKLYVEEKCLNEYKKRRARYERNLILATIVAVFLFLSIGIAPIFFGSFSLTSFLASILLGIMLLFFTVLIYSIPPIEVKNSKKGEE